MLLSTSDELLTTVVDGPSVLLLATEVVL